MSLVRRRGIGFKIQAAADTAETIAAGDIIYADDINFEEDHQPLERLHHLPTLSRLPDVAGRTFGKMSFKVPMYGGSAAGTAPFWGKVINACAFAETIVASTSVEYKLATTALKIATIKVFIDGISYQARDAKGSVAFSFKAGEVPFMTYSFTGLWEPRTDADAAKDEALLAGSALPSFLPKVFHSAQFKADTFKPSIDTFEFDIANELVLVPSGNVTDYLRVDITGRNPTGGFNIEAITKSAKDMRTLIDNKTVFVVNTFIGADDSGGGTGTLNTMTDASKNWPASKWASGFTVRDSADVVFAVTASDATTLTVAGTPADGDYVIYEAGKLIEVNIPEAQGMSIGLGDGDGINRFDIPIGLKSTTSDNEISIKLT